GIRGDRAACGVGGRSGQSQGVDYRWTCFLVTNHDCYGAFDEVLTSRPVPSAGRLRRGVLLSGFNVSHKRVSRCPHTFASDVYHQSSVYAGTIAGGSVAGVL